MKFPLYTGQADSTDNASDFYSGGARFESRLEHRLYWLRFLLVFLSSSWQVTKHYLRLDQDDYFLYSLKSNINFIKSSDYITWINDSTVRWRRYFFLIAEVKKTLWGRVIILKLIVAQLVNTFLCFCGRRRCILVFTRALHWTIYSHSLVQSSLILVWPSHLCLGLPKWQLPFCCSEHNFIWLEVFYYYCGW
jgi:hypothetical protein